MLYRVVCLFVRGEVDYQDDHNGLWVNNHLLRSSSFVLVSGSIICMILIIFHSVAYYDVCVFVCVCVCARCSAGQERVV